MPLYRTAAILLAPVLLLLPNLSFAGGNTQNQSFSKAKKLLHTMVYADHRTTFYCGCGYDETKKIDISTCGYKPKGRSKRAERVEWDHVVPAESFGQSFKEWREGHPDCADKYGKPFKGRKCAEKANLIYRYMQADMYNLYPAEGEINGLRENFSFAMIPSDRREFGECLVKIEDRKIEPRPEIRGDIARTYFYMDLAYPGHGIVSNKNQKLFEAWSKEDPADRFECERVRKIKELQGNTNEITEKACKEAGI